MNGEQETTAALLTKATPPISVSLASVSGIQVSDLVLWATLIYTALLIVHKLVSIARDFKKL